MTAAYDVTNVSVQIDGVSNTIKLLDWQNAIGSRPGRARIEIIDAFPSQITNATLRQKNATITLDGVQVFTGLCLGITKGYKYGEGGGNGDRSVQAVLYDNQIGR